jgi:hypothetical protein
LALLSALVLRSLHPKRSAPRRIPSYFFALGATVPLLPFCLLSGRPRLFSGLRQTCIGAAAAATYGTGIVFARLALLEALTTVFPGATRALTHGEASRSLYWVTNARSIT